MHERPSSLFAARVSTRSLDSVIVAYRERNNLGGADSMHPLSSFSTTTELPRLQEERYTTRDFILEWR
jgi:hypothetical protein